MNGKFSKFSPRLMAASVALSLGLAAGAFAMPPRDSERGGPGMHAHGMEHGLRDISRLHDDLKLDAKQEALWQDAEKAARESMTSMRERMRKQHEETLSMLNQPGADLRAVLKRMDDLRAEGQKQREAGREHWLAVYDTLNADQKEKARLFFKSKMERLAQFGQRDPGRGGNKR